MGFEAADINLYVYVRNRPLNYSDPFGLFQWYGNWGGPDYTGGQVGGCTKINWTRALPPLDKQDECYRIHDSCYCACRDNYSCNCPGDRRTCFRECDRQLSQCLKNLRGDPSHNLSAIIAGWFFSWREPGSECKK